MRQMEIHHQRTPFIVENATAWLKAALWVLILMAVFVVLSDSAFASTADEFKESADKAEGLIKGNLGKFAALLCLGVGLLVAAWRKDYTWLFGSIVLVFAATLIVGLINVTFTAVI
jgi:conjugal transfer pilus assembly protein TraA